MESSAPIYRFKISQNELQDKLIDFASYHKYEDAATLKESYKQWLTQEDISGLVSRETYLMLQNGYDFKQQSLEDKLFKSMKYYHIKKMLNQMNLGQGSSISSSQDKWKNQVQFSKDLLDKVKMFLVYENGLSFKPSKAFDQFQAWMKEAHPSKMEEEETRLNITTKDEFDYKLKKMFKNQYFVTKTQKNNKDKE